MDFIVNTVQIFLLLHSSPGVKSKPSPNYADLPFSVTFPFQHHHHGISKTILCFVIYVSCFIYFWEFYYASSYCNSSVKFVGKQAYKMYAHWYLFSDVRIRNNPICQNVCMACKEFLVYSFFFFFFNFWVKLFFRSFRRIEMFSFFLLLCFS